MSPGMDKESFYEANFQKDMYTMSDKYGMFLDIIKALKPARYLDVGCGDGSFATVVKETVECEVYGSDIAGEAIERAKQKGVLGVTVDTDTQALPFADGFFDCIFCGEVIEHVYSPDRLLEEIHRVLKPGGRLLLTTPNLASWFNRISLLLGYQPIFSDISLQHSHGHLWPMGPMGHLRLYTYPALKKLLALYGLNEVEARGIGINTKVGFGQKHPWAAKTANKIFAAPKWNSGILMVAERSR